eukprot:COSAG06_NODE_9609_length_1859_cov_1.629545_2_plen_31_part_01
MQGDAEKEVFPTGLHTDKNAMGHPLKLLLNL